jgi:hypothetical protein
LSMSSFSYVLLALVGISFRIVLAVKVAWPRTTAAVPRQAGQILPGILGYSAVARAGR